MKSPIDTVVGRIVEYDPASGKMVIEANYPDWYTLINREYKKCLIQMVDNRSLSDKQRKACYAMLGEIADYTGMGMEEAKQWMKIKFIVEDLQQTADKLFSLSDSSMSLVCAFQKFLIDFILSWNIPTRFPLIEMVDDIGAYIYSCLKNKTCCVCGKHADLHHSEHAVGMGRNRKTIVHEGMVVLPLCREHHTEAHTIGKTRFKEKYHLNDGIPLDKALCRIYGLKAGKDAIEEDDYVK